ncbi:carboxylesterase/lipase family protein [Aldersonia sp. NBC_00410]|uniref:carboxylesterase/lipase family protein n=1 Tax=Aldersonia sp. NBC_00410 TaxID=2975954 RepID=UPI00225B6D6B|nr:carboxylesterase/lipase family protein [Aldersonia sp. NBC_00410]MCX5043644.1 carboxylesterase/lipase family protein [Aldersonia sp. NBC_00410]
MDEFDTPAAPVTDTAVEPVIGAGPVVETTCGPVRGVREDSTSIWRSIPYAASIAGPGRFRAPRPPEPWTQIRDCTKFGEIAPQSLNNFVPVADGLHEGPDCLWLNVFAPAYAVAPDSSSTRPLPVMVWIHGGAYCLGTGAQTIYDGRRLAALGDVVVVTINYRLGAFGFIDFSSMSSDDAQFDSNLGLRDQIAALEWVRDNIASFGGDPDKVTIFGESSGGASVTTLLTIPATEGLFHRAIAQSPPATSVYGPERAANVASLFLDLLGLTPRMAADLYEMPAGRIAEATNRLIDKVATTVPGTLAIAPVVDGELIPRYPVSAFRKGLAHPVPLIIGTNKDETTLFRMLRSTLIPVTPSTVSEMLRQLAAEHPDLPPDRVAQIVAAYPHIGKSRGAMALATDAGFRMPSVWIAEGHSRIAPTWLYRFDYATPMLKAARVGAGHAMELPYVFGNFGTIERDPTFWLGGKKSAMEVAGRIQRRWLAFAAHGVPAALDASKHWAPYDESKRATLLIDSTDTLADDPDHELREAWGDRVTAFP